MHTHVCVYAYIYALLLYYIIYAGCPKKVETRFNFLDIEDKYAV